MKKTSIFQLVPGMILAKECGFDTLSFFVERQMLEIKNNV